MGTSNYISLENSFEARLMLNTSPWHSLMFMHNHPNNSCFSHADLSSFSSHDSLFVATAIGNNGNIHIMMKGPNFNGTSVIYEYNKHVNKNKGVEFVLKHCSMFDLWYKFGRYSK